MSVEMVEDHLSGLSSATFTSALDLENSILENPEHDPVLAA